MAAGTAAIIGFASQAAGGIYSLHQAGEMRREQKEAEKKAAKSMEEARRRLEVNYFKELSIHKETYELQREAALSSSGMALEAAREGDPRGVGATAGRMQMANNELQGGIRSGMAGDMFEIDKMVATEDARLRDANVGLDMGEIEGAQLAASDAWKGRQAHLASGVGAIAGAFADGFEDIHLYHFSDEARGARKDRRGDLANSIRSRLTPPGRTDKSPSDVKKPWDASNPWDEKGNYWTGPSMGNPMDFGYDPWHRYPHMYR